MIYKNAKKKGKHREHTGALVDICNLVEGWVVELGVATDEECSICFILDYQYEVLQRNK